MKHQIKIRTKRFGISRRQSYLAHDQHYQNRVTRTCHLRRGFGS